MTIIQETKKTIDVGELGNPSTGDILYDGGTFINSNFNSIYNAFGDQRLGAVADGKGTQLIHATGYYQKVSQYDFRTPISVGTQWDVDTTTGAASPILSNNAKSGECTVFVNTNGSWSVSNPLVISISGGTFVNIQGSLSITTPFSKVTCWCIKNESGVSVWDYKIESLFGSSQTIIDNTFPISAGQATKVRISNLTEYNFVKLICTASNANGSKLRSSEINLMIDPSAKRVFSTEYAVLRGGALNEDDEIVNIGFEVDQNNNVNMLVSSSILGMKLAIKSIATQRIGAA